MEALSSNRSGFAEPKTANEYLNVARAFLNWLKRQGRISVNPLEGVIKVDVRGRQQKRRAVTQEELEKNWRDCCRYRANAASSI